MSDNDTMWLVNAQTSEGDHMYTMTVVEMEKLFKLHMWDERDYEECFIEAGSEIKYSNCVVKLSGKKMIA